MGAPVNPVWVSGHYRFENDDGTLTSSTFIAAEDTTITQAADANFRLRINWGESAGQNQSDPIEPILQFRINAGAWANVGLSTAIQYKDSTNETDNAVSTTERLTTAPTGVATYVNSKFDTNNNIGSYTPVDEYYEAIFNLFIDSAQATNNDTIDFQLVDSSGTETFDTVDTVPTLTASVAASETITITKATMAVLSGQFLLVNESIIPAKVTWQVLTGQNINLAEQYTMTLATWPVLIEQSFKLNSNITVNAATFAQLVGQTVFTLGDEILTLNAGTLAQLVGQLIELSVDVTDIIDSSTFAQLVGKPITLSIATTEIVSASTFAQIIGTTLTITDGSTPVLVENLWRTTEETIRVKDSFEITDIDRDYP